MPKVSIIVPTYNVEKYLRQAIDSLINQTLKDIEIICVDDGSTDNSGKILDEYAQKDNRIKVIHKENEGYGKAMNIGLDNTTGEYIGIVEPDDYVELDMYETLYNKAKEQKVDFVKGNFIKFNESLNMQEELCTSFDKTKIYDKVIEPWNHLEVFQGAACIWSAIYNHQFLKEKNIRALETPGGSFQDTGFWIDVLFQTRKCLFIKNAFNHYRTGHIGQSVKSNSKVFCICDEFKALEAKYFDNPDYVRIINALKIDKYTWNWNRLNQEGKTAFIDVYVKELSDIIKQKNYEKACVNDAVLKNCQKILRNENKVKVSVIIPVYNCENYLKEALDSVVNQTLKEIEIICVDDCSSDNSLAILQEYAAKDSRVRVIALKENIKQGGARNRALDIANGSYIMFVDADDYVEPNIVEDFYKKIQENNVDIVISHVNNFSQDKHSLTKTLNFSTCYNNLKKSSGCCKFENNFMAYRSGPVAKLFIKDIIDEYNIRFPERLINEDEAFHWMYFSQIDSIYFIEQPYYNRRVHKNSTMFLRDTYNIGIIDEIEVIKYAYNFLVKHDLFEKYRTCFKSYYNSRKQAIMQRCRHLNAKKHISSLRKICSEFENISHLGLYNSNIEKLFSVKNSFDKKHKIITILGIQIKIKRSSLNKILSAGNMPSGDKWYKVIYVLGIKFSFRNKKKEREVFAQIERDNLKLMIQDLQKQNEKLQHIIEQQNQELKSQITSQLQKMDTLKCNMKVDKQELLYKIYKYLPDEKRSIALADWFYNATGEQLHLDNPQTFNEKIQWLKLYDSTPEKTRLADKYLVRDWVKEKIGEEYLIPLLGVWDNFDDIDFDTLPNQFVIKCNHGCGYNIIVKDKSKLDIQDARKKINQWMNEDFAFRNGFELHYSAIKPKIIIEKFIENSGNDLYDYKFWCFNGKADYVQFLSERNTNGLKMAFYNQKWEKQNFVYSFPLDQKNITKPNNIDKMFELAEKLAKGFPHVRVDFYRLDDGKIYFGEMTFTSASGACKWNNEKINIIFGKKIKLPKLATNTTSNV